MATSNRIIPVFYVRGYNSPYTEAHIKVVDNMVKALSSQEIRSIVFNYKYNANQPENAQCLRKTNFEQTIPMVSREEIFHGRRRSVVAYSSLMETLATLRFMLIERNLRENTHRYVVNMVNCFRYPRIFAKHFLRAPVVAHFYIRKAMMGSLVKVIADRVDGIITSSRTVARYIEKTYSISEKKIEIVYPPTDVDFYRPVDKIPARRKLGLPKEDKIILYIGNLRSNRFPEKVVLQALRSLIKEKLRAKLLIFAPRSSENMKRSKEIEAKTKEMDLTTIVRIRVEDLSEEEKGLIYAGSDLLIFPSLDPTAATEPPLTLLEAMATGLPVISTDSSSIREIIDDGINGFITSFNGENGRQLTEKISSLVGDPEIIAKLSFNARQSIVKKMSFEGSYKKLLEIYEKCLES